MGLIERYGHGGDLVSAAETFGVNQSQLLDFSANINPLGPPQNVLDTLIREIDSIIHYPDPAHRLFRKTLAKELEIDSESILVGNGAAECMAIAIQGISPQVTGVIYPCFSEYAQLANHYGSEVKGCIGDAEYNFLPNKHDLYRLFEESDLVIIGHPNNPTGLLIPMDLLLEFAKWTVELNVYLLVDEAFIDFVSPKKRMTFLPFLHQYPRVIIIRSLTKFYAIPGLRLGYAVAHPTLIDRMKEKQITWSVNQLALLAGDVCMHEKEYEEVTRCLIETERAYLIKEIRTKFKWRVWEGEANFLLIRLPSHITAKELQFLLGCRGIMIRDCSMYPGLGPHDFRIAVRTREENGKLLNVLKEVIDTKFG